MPWKNRIPRLCTGFAVLATLASPVLAQTVHYSDASFDDADWELTQATFGNGGAAAASQNGADGVPAPSRDVEQTVAAAPVSGESTIAGLHVHGPARYSPQVLGAIESLDWSVDYANVTGCSTTGMGQRFGLGIEQDGEFFTDPDFFTGSFAGFFLPHLQDTLEADDFARVDLGLPGHVDPDVHPDFDAGAPDLTFGLYTADSTTGAGFTRCTLWDNWAVTLRHTPAANTLPACAELFEEDFELLAPGSDLCAQPGWSCAPGEDDPLRVEVGVLGSRVVDGHATPGPAAVTTTARHSIPQIGSIGTTVLGFTARAFSAATVQSHDAPVGLRNASGSLRVSWSPADRYPGSGTAEDQWLFCVTGHPCRAHVGGFDQPVAARIFLDPHTGRTWGELSLSTGTVTTPALPLSEAQIASLAEVFVAVESSDTSLQRGAQIDQLVLRTTECSVPTLPGPLLGVTALLLLASASCVLHRVGRRRLQPLGRCTPR